MGDYNRLDLCPIKIGRLPAMILPTTSILLLLGCCFGGIDAFGIPRIACKPDQPGVFGHMNAPSPIEIMKNCYGLIKDIDDSIKCSETLYGDTRDRELGVPFKAARFRHVSLPASFSDGKCFIHVKSGRLQIHEYTSFESSEYPAYHPRPEGSPGTRRYFEFWEHMYLWLQKTTEKCLGKDMNAIGTFRTIFDKRQWIYDFEVRVWHPGDQALNTPQHYNLDTLLEDSRRAERPRLTEKK
jgi:hypothetical protein